ncbi:MAG: TRAP transporter small permease subunit, partial [Pseudomonadota bacterium]
GYVFAAGTTWAYSYALIHRNNVRIDALYNVLPLWLRALLDVVALALLLLFMGVLTTQAYTVFETSWIQNSRSVTTLALPLWLPQLLWFAGLALFVFTLSFLLLYAVVLLLRGDLAQLQRIAGTLSVQEEVEESTQGIRELEGRSPTPPSARPDQER